MVFLDSERNKAKENLDSHNCNPVRSPLRYPGSKRRLANYVRQALQLNNIRPSLYVEPFVGGASIGLQLMQYDLVDKVIFMDLDPWVASFWDTLFFDTEWLITKIRSTNVTLKLWNELKTGRPRSRREQAWTCFYLNRTSFSGILEKKAGPLGGQKQESEYKIDCRYPGERLIERIEKIANFRDKVWGVWNCSWEDGITSIRKEQKQKKLPPKDTFYYLDPPFFEEAEDLYRYYFDEADHIRLRDYLFEFKDNWLLSYDYADQVNTLYGDAIRNRINGTNHRKIDIYYSLAVLSKRYMAKEVIISNLPKLPTQ